MLWEHLMSLGVDPSMVLAGLLGGACKSLAMQEGSATSTGINAIVGAAVANYFGPSISVHFGWEKLPTGFASGALGIMIMQTVVKYGPKLIPASMKGTP